MRLKTLWQNRLKIIRTLNVVDMHKNRPSLLLTVEISHKSGIMSLTVRLKPHVGWRGPPVKTISHRRDTV